MGLAANVGRIYSFSGVVHRNKYGRGIGAKGVMLGSFGNPLKLD
jgi:hypothetical protein